MRSKPIHHAPHSGYERLESGRALMVADVGPCPPTHLSAEVGASCLSFEFSSGAQRIIVNCGLPRTANDAVVQAARLTQANSTASIDDASSCRFLSAQAGWWLERALARWLLRRLGPVALRGPATVTVERGERDRVQVLDASHDGYRARFGLRHERRWRLSGEGQRLEGEDLFHPEGTALRAREATIRFHLAPGIKASRAQGGRIVMLILPNREAWQFEASPGEAWLEDSVFFSAPDGARRTEQIVLAVNPAETPSVRWRFERLMRPPEAATQQRQAEPAPELL
jgi:uncharacterized heparinase superfamily protein